MFEEWKKLRKIKKDAKKKAVEQFKRLVEFEQKKKDFLKSPDDTDFLAAVFRGIEGTDRVKNIIIRKNNGTTIQFSLQEGQKDRKQENWLDWVNFNAMTDSQGTLKMQEK